MTMRHHRVHFVAGLGLGAALLWSALAGGVTAADRPDGCPAKLGALKYSSGEVSPPDERFPKARCFYRSDDWDKQATIRAAWIPAGDLGDTLDMETTYCLSQDEARAGEGQYGEGTRTGRVFPTGGERFVLGSYLATPKGAGTAKIAKAAQALAASYAPLAASCPTIGAADAPVPEEAPAGSGTFSDDEIFGGILDVADELQQAQRQVQQGAFDREAVGACLGVDSEDTTIDRIGEVDLVDTVMRACLIFPLILDELPAEQASEVMVIVVALLLADEERRQAEATPAE